MCVNIELSCHMYVCMYVRTYADSMRVYVECLSVVVTLASCSDGKARVFTLDATRQAPEREVALFEEESLKFKCV